MNSKRFRYLCSVVAILFSGVMTPLVQPLVAVAAPPDTPGNISPTDGATGIELTPMLVCSAFLDSDNDTHAASQWQIAASDSHDTNPDGSYSTTVFDYSIVDDSTSVVVPSGELNYSATYYWHVSYQDSTGAWSAWSTETSFTTTATPVVAPTVTTNPATYLAATSALLNGSLTGLGTASSVQVSFEWGLTTSYGNITTSQAMTATSTFGAPLSGLTPGATYHFRAKAMGDSDGYGDDMTFTTAIPPTVTTNDATRVAPTSATLNGTLTSLGTAGSVNVSFQWGLTNAYGNTTTMQTRISTGTFSADISGLTSGATYHFRARAIGGGTPYGDDMIFTTLSLPNQPTNISPANGATGIGLTPSLQSSAFSGSDAEDTHAGSQWQITTTTGNYSNPVFDSGLGTSNLVLVPSGTLRYSTTYYWHVRYQDNHEDWSSWSAETSFTTDEVVAFPDPGLAAAIREAIGKPTGEIYQSDLDGLTQLDLDANGRGIVDLTGLEHCTSLSILSLLDNQISDISPIAGLTNLTLLDLSSNQVSDIKPLVNNVGMGSGDEIDLRANPLNSTSVNTWIAALEARGAMVVWDTDNQSPSQSPVVEGVDPSRGRRGQYLTITISGADFDGATSVSFGSGVTVEGYDVNSRTEITAGVTIGSDAELGARDVSVTTPTGTDTKTGGFAVTAGSSRLRWWVYPIAVVGGLLVLMMLVAVGARVVRRFGGLRRAAG